MSIINIINVNRRHQSILGVSAIAMSFSGWLIIFFTNLAFLRIAFGIAIILMPGILVMFLLFPDSSIETRWIQTALSLPASIAVISLLLLIVHYFGVYTFASFIFLICGVNSVLGVMIIYGVGREPGSYSEKDKSEFAKSLIPISITILVVFFAQYLLVYRPDEESKLSDQVEFLIIEPSVEELVDLNTDDQFPDQVIASIINNENRDVVYKVEVIGLQNGIPQIYGTEEVEVLKHSFKEIRLDNQDYFTLAIIDELYLNLFRESDDVPFRTLSIR